MNWEALGKMQRSVRIIGYIFLGVFVGYLCFDDSRELSDLKSKVAEEERQHQGLATAGASSSHRSQAYSFPHRSLPGTPADSTNDSSSLISEADIAEALALNDRAAHGEYILQFERPVDRKLMEAGIKAFSAQTASNNAMSLRRAFTVAGVTPDKIPQLEKHQEKIMLASLEVEQAMQQVLSARNDYDRRVRELMSDDGYASYRQYEDSQPALREYDLLSEYARKNQYPVDSSYQQQIAALIQQAQAYTQTWPHGPYDGLPQITVGRETVTAQLQDQINQIGQAARALDQAATQAGLPAEYFSVLDGYYAQVVQQKQDAIARINNPPGPTTANK